MNDAGSESQQAREATWGQPAERLDRALPALGLARSRTQAAELIAGGGVRVDGAVVTKAGTKVAAGSRIAAPAPDRYVSRAAHKLIAGLDAFGIDPRGRLALDLGASTGGFTQVLLERGARAVQAIDVGHGQLAPELRDDPRVLVVEGCNARDLTPEALASATGAAEPPTLVVVDLSFISLTLILPAIARCTGEGQASGSRTELVLLIKPQFEVGRVRDGIVVQPRQRADAMRAVLETATRHGFACLGLEVSPILGGRGNVEYVAGFEAGSAVGRAALDQTEWEGRIAELSAATP